MKSILITGSTGMLGSHLFKVFNGDSNYKTYCLNRMIDPRVPEERQRVVDLSKEFGHEILEIEPDIMIHAAAITDLALCELNPGLAERVNAGAARTLAGLVNKSGKFFFISTDSVFDGSKGNYSETDLPNPLNTYAKTKLLGEKAVVEVHDKCTIIRTNIYGFHSPLRKSLAEWAFQEWGKGNKITGFTDTIFNAVYTKQLAQIIKFMVDESISLPIINIGSISTLSKFEFLDMFRTTLKLDRYLLEPALSADMPTSVPRPKDTSLNISLLKSIYTPPSFEEGLNEWLADYKEEFN